MRKKPTKEQLWKKYFEDRDDKTFKLLMEEYLSIVEVNARSIAKNLPSHVDVDDLISDGYFGLADAIRKYDNILGYQFETYASFRIRGEILDKLRVADWAPRSLRSKSKEITTASSKLSMELGRQPTVEELSQLLEQPVEDINKVMSDVAVSAFSNIDDMVNMNGSKFSLSDLIPDSSIATGDYNFTELKAKLIKFISELSPESRTVLALYYVEDLPLREIGDMMMVTESRACQIHTNTLEKLWNSCVEAL